MLSIAVPTTRILGPLGIFKRFRVGEVNSPSASVGTSTARPTPAGDLNHPAGYRLPLRLHTLMPVIRPIISTPISCTASLPLATSSGVRSEYRKYADRQMTNIGGIDGQTILMGEINDVPQIVPVVIYIVCKPSAPARAISRISVLATAPVAW